MRMAPSGDSPAEAEESQVEAQQRGHHVSDEGAGLAGVEVDPKPHSHQEGKQLTRHKVHLRRGTCGCDVTAGAGFRVLVYTLPSNAITLSDNVLTD